MKRTTILPSREVLCQIFSYDPELGELRWKKRPREQFSNEISWKKFNSQMVGRVVGTKQFRKSKAPSCIMVRFRVSGKDYATPATAIIWGMLGREIPEGMEIDHRNRNPFDNRLDNLRIGTGQQNSFNSVAVRRTTSLMKGVHHCRKRFKALIKMNGKTVHLGCFPTEQLAHEAYCKKALEIHGEFHCPDAKVAGG